MEGFFLYCPKSNYQGVLVLSRACACAQGGMCVTIFFSIWTELDPIAQALLSQHTKESKFYLEKGVIFLWRKLKYILKISCIKRKIVNRV